MLKTILNKKTLKLVLEGEDLFLQLGGVVRGDGGTHDWARHSAGTAESDLGGNEHVGDVLVLAQEGQVQNNLQRLGVSGHDDELGLTAVQSFGSLVSTLLKLAEIGGLLDDVEDLLGGLCVGEGKSSVVCHVD